MSAFIVSDKHIDAIVSFAIDRRASYYWKTSQSRTDINKENASEIGQKLLDENFRSVNHRYRESDKPSVYKFKRPAARFEAVDILKAIDSLDYQSCETDDWSESEAWSILGGIKDCAIRNLPGYENSNGWSL